MSNIKISVIIPIYNTEKYLEDCLDSVTGQTIAFDEIILINDGSTDSSLEICMKYANEYKNIKIINQTNKGQAVARNQGMENTKSDWIVFVDSDDFVRKDLVEILSKELKESNYDVVYYNASIVNNIENKEYDSKKYIYDVKMYEKDMTGMEYFLKSFEDKLNVQPGCAVYNKKFLQQNEIDFPEGYFYEDNLFYIKIVTNAKKVKCISNQLYVRRFREGSTTISEITKKKCGDLIQVYTLITKYIFERKYTHEETESLKQYIYNDFMYISKYITDFVDDNDIRESFYNLGLLIEQKWLEIQSKENISWDDSIKLLTIYNKIEVINRNDKLKETLEFILEQNIKKKLEPLGLNDKTKRIGIYGIGKHTESLLKLYEKYIGDVKCDLYYVVTNTDQSSFNGKLLYPVKNLNNYGDKIIISSLLYQKEMYKNLLDNNVQKEKIELLYSEEEKKDLVCIDNLE